MSVHFDRQFYSDQYPDIMLPELDLFDHFCEVGWIEGRNPNRHFDVVSYLIDYPDVAESDKNPFLHYLIKGKQEGRKATPSASPLERTAVLFGYTVPNWVSSLEGEVDLQYYRTRVPQRLSQRINLTAHFAYRGWREGFDPSSNVTFNNLVESYPRAAGLLVNPLLAFCEAKVERYSETFRPSRSAAFLAVYKTRSTDAVIEAVQREFDANFYSEEYPDILLSREFLLAHFCEIGWIEGRNPSPYFDVVDYLERYPDVAASNGNPFFHFLMHGKAEGRQAVSSVTPSVRSTLLFDYGIVDWVSALEPALDIEYYRNQLPRSLRTKIDPVAHFAYRGWRNGLNPHPLAAIESLIKEYPQAAELRVNPLLAHLEAQAGRYIKLSPACPPSEFGHVQPENPGDDLLHDESQQGSSLWTPESGIKIVQTEFDAEFYLTNNRDVAAYGIDPLEHFFYTGWREGRNPTSDFNTEFYLAKYPDVLATGVNPFWHFIAMGRAEGRLACDAQKATEELTSAMDEDRISTIREEFSVLYYLSQNADVAISDVDPVVHYYYEGWREGRNPNKNFDTLYYLEANTDVREAGVNPFWHYLIAGRAEDRPARRPGGFRRRIIDGAKLPELRTLGHRIPEAKELTKRFLAKRLHLALANRAGVAVSLSHDCYVHVVGGTQIFISDEEKKFAQRDFGYIHLSPRRAFLTFADYSPTFEVQIVLNGEFIGVASFALLTNLLHQLMQERASKPYMIVHSVLGFEESQLLALYTALSPTRAVYWLHDYTSLCEGYNLIRNDLEFCDAPPPESMACRVCIYGTNRKRHLERMKRIFEHCRFDVLSPSQFTLDLWLAKTLLPAVSAEAHPHWNLVAEAAIPSGGSGSFESDGPVRIAFVGFPTSGKGWEFFCALAEEFSSDPRYIFFHFAACGVATIPECTFVVCEVTPEDRWATTRLLREHSIDFVAMLSPWPETFSFVAHEAIAGGCQLLCFTDSGNVAATTRRLGRGYVFAGFSHLREFAGSPEIFDATYKARENRQTFEIVDGGTTATVSRLFDAEHEA
jgi:hypothetical protein